MSKWVEFSIQLPHSDGLGIQYVRMHSLKRDSPGCGRALQCRQGVAEHLITLCLPRDRRSDQHEAVTDHGGFIELDTLADESLDILQAFLEGALPNALLQVSVINWLLR